MPYTTCIIIIANKDTLFSFENNKELKWKRHVWRGIAFKFEQRGWRDLVPVAHRGGATGESKKLLTRDTLKLQK
jgi:hypothetical protein